MIEKQNSNHVLDVCRKDRNSLCIMLHGWLDAHFLILFHPCDYCGIGADSSPIREASITSPCIP